MKTNTFILITALIIAAQMTNPAIAQEPSDTLYQIEVTAENDTACFILVGEIKSGIDCNSIPAGVLVTPADTITPPNDATIETAPPTKPKPFNFIDFLKSTWLFISANILILLAVAEGIVRLTPTEKDNNILRLIQSWIDVIIPNRRKDPETGKVAGRFVAFKKPSDAPKLAHVPKTKK